jgi:hypothetical protein
MVLAVWYSFGPEQAVLLGSNALKSEKARRFEGTYPPLSSGSKRKPSKKPARSKCKAGVRLLFEPEDIGDMFFRSVGFSTLHGVIAQNNAFFIVTAVRI